MTVETNEQLAERLRAFVSDTSDLALIAEVTKAYWHTEPFTGRHFESIRDVGQPDDMTARDIVAVSMLGVEIPAPVSIWLLSDIGQQHVHDLLSESAADANIETDGSLLDSGGHLDTLWRLLDSASWPDLKQGNGMGRTKISKLLAAKRPHLVPIFDSVVEQQLGKVANYWTAYREALNPETVQRWAAATQGAPDGISLLRRIDAAIWMIGKRRTPGGNLQPPDLASP